MLRNLAIAVVLFAVTSATALAQNGGSDAKTGAGAAVGAPGTESSGGSGSGMSTSGGTNTGSSTTGTVPNKTADTLKLEFCPQPRGSENGGIC